MTLIKLRLRRMSDEKTAFATRLRSAMADAGMIAKKGAKGGVDATALEEAINSTDKRRKLVSNEAVRKWIAGKSLPRVDMLKLIAKILGVNVPWLRDGREPKTGEDITALKDDDERLIIRTWRDTAEESRAGFMALVKALDEQIRAKKKRKA
jgi:transcriptional regulator with XRE-family HTH domain